MRFRVKVRDSETGAVRVVEVVADSKEEARRLAHLQDKADQEAEPEPEKEGTVCSRCGAPVGFLSGLVLSLCKQCQETDRQQRQVDRQQRQAERAHAAHLYHIEWELAQAEARRLREASKASEAEASRLREASEAEASRQATAQRQAVEEEIRRARTVGPRGWHYKMVQIPPSIMVEEGGTTRGVAATYLERVVEEYAAFGWEFHRVDELGVIVNPGCLTLLFGGRPELLRYFVVTFRCPV